MRLDWIQQIKIKPTEGEEKEENRAYDKSAIESNESCMHTGGSSLPTNSPSYYLSARGFRIRQFQAKDLGLMEGEKLTDATKSVFVSFQ